MGFSLPSFPIVCNVYRGPWATKLIALTDEPCNLAWGRRVSTFVEFEADNSESIYMTLLLNPGVDIRDLKCAAVQDVVECPSGSGRWYQVASVDDFGKGFPNEHRGAVLFPISEALYPSGAYAGLLWPVPIP